MWAWECGWGWPFLEFASPYLAPSLWDWIGVYRYDDRSWIVGLTFIGELPYITTFAIESIDWHWPGQYEPYVLPDNPP